MSTPGIDTPPADPLDRLERIDRRERLAKLIERLDFEQRGLNGGATGGASASANTTAACHPLGLLAVESPRRSRWPTCSRLERSDALEA